MTEGRGSGGSAAPTEGARAAGTTSDAAVAAVQLDLTPEELSLVRTALALLQSTVRREEADELAAVQRLLRRLPPSDRP